MTTPRGTASWSLLFTPRLHPGAHCPPLYQNKAHARMAATSTTKKPTTHTCRLISPAELSIGRRNGVSRGMWKGGKTGGEWKEARVVMMSILGG